jgi:hypothetical protein
LLFEPTQIPFTDIKPTDWFAKDVANMYFAGIINGKSETKFDPNGYITRAEVAAMLNRFSKKLYEQDVLNKKCEEAYDEIF